MSRSARADWESRIGDRVDERTTAVAFELAAPERLEAESGVGQITLRWSPAAGAAGYVISRAAEDGDFVPLDHGGSDVNAVPVSPYADTDVDPGVRYRYAVAAVVDAGSEPGPRSEVVDATPRSGTPEPLSVHVDAAAVSGRLDRVWRLVGSERLSQLREGADRFGNEIGSEFRDALAQAHRELGVERVRAHAILHDDVGVFSWNGGEPTYDFDGVDRIYDEVLALGLRPVVEVSFMPRDLAEDSDATVFDYRGIISPPRDWSVWADLNARLAEHLVERYGIDEVVRFGFEIWNEPNLSVFWSGTQADYFRLYQVAAEAIKAVDERLLVGGPATAATDWIEEFVAFAAATDTPLDFLSTHTYGNVPLDVRASLRRHGLDDVEVWWTEWGAGATHFGPIHDAPYGAPFVLRGMKGAQGSVDELAYWVVSDHFEELGRPPRLLHNGFGLLTVGNLRKPRYWALKLAAELGDELLRVDVAGDGAESLVEAWAARDGARVDVLVWNGALNAAKFRGDAALDRTVRLRVEGLHEGRHDARLARVDERHSNIARHVPEDVDWPTAEQWEALRREDRLAEERLDDVEVHDGAVELELELPMPGVVRLRLEPQQTRSKGGTQA